jgi:uncharacterized membrane protein
MNRFVVLVFPDETRAFKALHALWELHREGALTVFGTSVVAREKDGKLSVKQQVDEGPLGFGVGTLTGSLIGVFGGPVGMAVGAVAGGMFGAVTDLFQSEVSMEFVEDVKRDLAPGKYAVVAEVAEDWLIPLEASVAELDGIVIREPRGEYVDALVERTVEARKSEFQEWNTQRAADFAKWKAERASAVAERMQTTLDARIERARTKLQRTAENARDVLDRTKAEMEAKVHALEEQASHATPEVKERIRRRIKDVRGDLEMREKKLAHAYQLTQEALHP